MNTHTPVIIIGAGIAGLAAAWHLKKRGIDALILEADEIVGGRMNSIIADDAIIDYGAQFLSSAYTIIPNLIKEMGLTHELSPCSGFIGFGDKTKITVIHSQKPWQLFSKKIISLPSLLRLGFNQFKLFKLDKNKYLLNDITSWVKFDTDNAEEWSKKYFGSEIAEKLTSTIINGFYFQSLKDSSGAFTAAALGFSAHNPQTITINSGMGALPQQLAHRLNVLTKTTAQKIIEKKDDIKVITDNGEFFADHVIVTVPAPIAKMIIQDPDTLSQKLLNTNYCSSVLISLLIKDEWKPPAKLKSVYGIIYRPEEDNKIAAVTIENNKSSKRKKQGFLINIMLTDAFTKKISALSTDDIYHEIEQEIEIIFPKINQHIYLSKTFKWQHAMPYTPVGRPTAVKNYRDTRSRNNRLWLAGDYLGLPWTDSAAQTGIWAANQIFNNTKP